MLYFLFGNDAGVRFGGWYDHIETFVSDGEAVRYFEGVCIEQALSLIPTFEWAHIVKSTGEIVKICRVAKDTNTGKPIFLWDDVEAKKKGRL